jgi:hypothetical protein
VEIRDIDGQQYVRLTPISYQFGTAVDPFDRNWLMIRGSARSSSEKWSFIDASLLAGEAQNLTSWLRAMARREAKTMAPGAAEPTWSNIEPNLGMGVVRYDDEHTVLRVFLRLESAPPSAPEMEYFLDLRVTSAMLEEAAEAWSTELEGFPPR